MIWFVRLCATIALLCVSGCENPLINKELTLERLEPMFAVQNLAADKCLAAQSQYADRPDAERNARSLREYYQTIHAGMASYLDGSPRIDSGLLVRLREYVGLAADLSDFFDNAIDRGDYSGVANGNQRLNDLIRHSNDIEAWIADYVAELIE